MAIIRPYNSHRQVHKRWSLIAVFTFSIFLSATLLFSVQPMFAKMVLPLLGGTPNVWNTAMVFFQATLLFGYLYAHLLAKSVALKTQILIHTGVMLLGCLFLPLSIAQGWTPPEDGSLSLWLIALFGVSVGIPFFAISANAPLLQKWFSRTDDEDAEDPYFLYGASNAGSLLSLCMYPVLIEPMMAVQGQTTIWAIVYAVLILAIFISGFWALRHPGHKEKETAESLTQDEIKPITLKMRLIWVFLAFIPSSLMLGVTTNITYNIASAPFLWIIPLALYLLTFIIAFAKRPIITERSLKYLVPIAIVTAFWFSYGSAYPILAIIISLCAYFIIALGAHTRLVNLRPTAKNLTEFYIWMSLGGVIGGVFNALISPIIFTHSYELPLVLVLSTLIFFTPKWNIKHDVLKGDAKKAIIITLTILAIFVATRQPITPIAIMIGGFIVFILSLFSKSPKYWISTSAPVIILASFGFASLNSDALLKERSFFGIMSVEAIEGEFGYVHRFQHGNTVHNYQLQNETLKKVPLAYYASDNTFDRGLRLARSFAPSETKFNVAMIGLGAGAMACYEKPSDNWVYFEIDPAVVNMAKDDRYFSYLSQCSYKSDIRLGDARLKLNSLPDNSQDYIIVDAFSSDSIPAHLVTHEALTLYRSKLKDTGIVFFHTSNRMLDINSVVANIAKSHGLESRYIKLEDFEDSQFKSYITASSAMIVGTEAQMSAAENFDLNWNQLVPSPDVGTWTDDYSHIYGTLIAHIKKNRQVIQPTSHTLAKTK